MLDDSLAHLKRQIQSTKCGVPQLEILGNSQRMQIVIERRSMLPHRGIECFLPRMSERRMPNVVHQRQHLDQTCVQPKLCGNRPRDLRDFNRVCQPVAKMIGVPPCKNLRLRFEPAKRTRMDDAITVALKGVAVGMRRLGMAASARLLYAHGIVGQHQKSLAAETRLTVSSADCSAARTGRFGKCGSR